MLNITHYQRNANQDHIEVPFHASQNGCYQKVYKQQMLERVWRKGNPLPLLVRMQTSTATMKNSVEIRWKTGNRTALWPSIRLGIHTKETRIERDTCTPMFIAALFIIARPWKQSRCPSADESVSKLWYKYTMEYYSAIKKNAFESVLRGGWNWSRLQSEVSQNEKHQCSILMHIYGI